MNEQYAPAEGVLRGDTRALARAVSTIENHGAGALDLLKAIYPHTGRATVIGMTGSPGVGKSTLVDKLAAHYRRAGDRVGIIAVDPSSAFSGGAILGDRIRMQQLGLDSGVFIRSMATRGHLGGLAGSTADVATLLDAAGFSRILVETVGVGQDEVEVARMADVTLVVLVPGMGDDIQASKAGIMEIADIFVINKSDREGAERLEQNIQAQLELGRRPDGWTVPVARTVATEDRGTTGLAEKIESFLAFRRESPSAREWREDMAEERLLQMLRDRLTEEARVRAGRSGDLKAWATQIVERRRDPYSVVDELVSQMLRADTDERGDPPQPGTAFAPAPDATER
ncbi:MAG: methylmalonyl Co-A mutase-associated GTPase MeaB [Acidobacteria bacterium]|nr:methylmalonyl Co-A mutase-associated GTPase MeaB [Acidobacteriota bacterium]